MLIIIWHSFEELSIIQLYHLFDRILEDITNTNLRYPFLQPCSYNYSSEPTIGDDSRLLYVSQVRLRKDKRFSMFMMYYCQYKPFDCEYVLLEFESSTKVFGWRMVIVRYCQAWFGILYTVSKTERVILVHLRANISEEFRFIVLEHAPLT